LFATAATLLFVPTVFMMARKRQSQAEPNSPEPAAA